MDKLLFRWLMGIWTRRAQKRYGGPGERGELFNTANFQCAVGQTTGQSIDGTTAGWWLIEAGFHYDNGGCHWFDSAKKAKNTDFGRVSIVEI